MDAPTKTQKDVSKNFVPIPDLENMAVGHAGLYPIDQEIDEITSSADVLDPIINIGTGKGEKILLDVEPGVKLFIKDALCKKLDSELEKYGLSKDMERVKAIPNSMTGAVIYYLTKGIERDFGITWVKTPVSIRKKETKLAKDIADGKRILSKKKKNELLEKTEWQYWSNKIASGELEMQDAISMMQEKIAEVESLKAEGVYLSPNKTEGVKLFDWKSIVENTTQIVDGHKVYTRNKIEIVVPDLMNNFYSAESEVNKKLVKEVLKSDLWGTALKIANKKGIKDYGVYDDDYAYKPSGGFENFDVNTIDELMQFYSENRGRELDMKELKNGYNINAVHLVKIRQPGMMKPRYVCWDITNKSSGERCLKLMVKDDTATYKDITRNKSSK